VKRTDVTYGQLDRVLKSLGFSCRLIASEPPTRFYEHKASGAELMLPPFPDNERVVDYHLVAARLTLENYGIANKDTFTSALQKAG
jgi:hypothetical protein